MSILVNHTEAAQLLELNLSANNPVFLHGSPAIGKSALVHSVAKSLNAVVIDLRLSTLQQYDLGGLPHNYINADGVNVFSLNPLDEFPLKNTSQFPDALMIILFLDEFNSADRPTMAAAYKLILDRKISKHDLDRRVRIICAGNRLEDGAIVNALPSPIKSRLSHMELQVNSHDWLKWLETQTSWNSKILAFLKFKPNQIYTFDPKSLDLSYASPRTWEMLSKQINLGLLEQETNVMSVGILGTVGTEAGRDFMSWLRCFDELPTIDEIIANPSGSTVPAEAGKKWAMISMLVENANKDSIKSIVEYIARFKEKDLQLLTLKQIEQRKPSLMLLPDVVKLSSQLVGYVKSI